MHKDVLEIVERLGNFPRPISDVKFNLWIKQVCKNVGMLEQIKGTMLMLSKT